MAILLYFRNPEFWQCELLFSKKEFKKCHFRKKFFFRLWKKKIENFGLKMGIDGNFILKLNFDNDWFDIENIQKYKMYFVRVVIFALEICCQHCWWYLWTINYDVLKWLWIMVLLISRKNLEGKTIFVNYVFSFRKWPIHEQKWPKCTLKMTQIAWTGVSVKSGMKIGHFELKLTIQKCKFQNKGSKIKTVKKSFSKTAKHESNFLQNHHFPSFPQVQWLNFSLPDILWHFILTAKKVKISYFMIVHDFREFYSLDFWKIPRKSFYFFLNADDSLFFLTPPRAIHNCSWVFPFFSTILIAQKIESL